MNILIQKYTRNLNELNLYREKIKEDLIKIIKEQDLYFENKTKIQIRKNFDFIIDIDFTNGLYDSNTSYIHNEDNTMFIINFYSFPIDKFCNITKLFNEIKKYLS